MSEWQHEWDDNRFGFTCCNLCGLIKREDGKNKPCNGPGKLRPMEKSAPYYGHMTMADGSHVPLTEEQAREIWDACEKAQEDRAKRMPDEQAALKVLQDAYTRLKELGWRDAIYCPKDGSIFEAIEAGSTGVHDCTYHGEWPKGSWLVHGEGDLWPSRPILFRPKPPPQQSQEEA